MEKFKRTYFSLKYQFTFTAKMNAVRCASAIFLYQHFPHFRMLHSAFAYRCRCGLSSWLSHDFLLSTLFHSSRTRVWMSTRTLVRTSSCSHFTQSLEELPRQECKPDFTCTNCRRAIFADSAPVRKIKHTWFQPEIFYQDPLTDFEKFYLKVSQFGSHFVNVFLTYLNFQNGFVNFFFLIISNIPNNFLKI